MRLFLFGGLLIALGCGDSSDPPGGHGGHDAGGGGEGGLGGSGGGDGGGGFSGTPQVIMPKTGLGPEELAILVNDQDPQSVAVAAAYGAARGIPASRVVTLSFAPGASVMSAVDFAPLKATVDAALGDDVQILAITWTAPYRVDCMSMTSAFALGFDLKWCNQSGGPCGPTSVSPYYNSPSVAPWTDHGIRPAMMIAGVSEAEALGVIDHGVAADDTFPIGDGYMIRTTDMARSVRWPVFLATANGWNNGDDLAMTYLSNSNGAGSDVLSATSDVLFYFTGLAQVPDIETNTYLPGAIADHLTSVGGQLTDSFQMSVLRWLEAGATGSYGTVVEPCNYLEKFPSTQVVVPQYFRGNTLIEAYWKSVAWPGEGVFVGEPLARPWGAHQIDIQADRIAVTTTALVPNRNYDVLGGPTEDGPWEPVVTGLSIQHHLRWTFEIPEVSKPFYTLVAAP